MFKLFKKTKIYAKSLKTVVISVSDFAFFNMIIKSNKIIITLISFSF